MHPVPNNLVKQFASFFAGQSRGFSAAEISTYFGGYFSGIPTFESYKINPTRNELFCDCVGALPAETQFQALADLCNNPPSSKYAMPIEEERRNLFALLCQAHGSTPISVSLSNVSLAGCRQRWFTAASRLPDSPSGAITAARTLLESTLKTVISEFGQVPDDSGDLARLYRQASECLELRPGQGASQDTHQLLSGLATAVQGIASMSNRAGDRHGLVGGGVLFDLALAGLIVHAAGTISYFLAETHLQRRLTQTTPNNIA